MTDIQMGYEKPRSNTGTGPLTTWRGAHSAYRQFKTPYTCQFLERRVDTVPILYISPTVVIAGSPKRLAPVLSLSINAMLS